MTCEPCGESGHDEENCDVKKYQRSKTEKSDKYRKAYAALGVCVTMVFVFRDIEGRQWEFGAHYGIFSSSF